MTFRSRLLLTILAMVILTTSATLYMAQRQSSASYQAVVDELLRNQAGFFQREQHRRHQQAGLQVSRLASSVRLFAALEASDPAVYQVARDELRLEEFSFFRLLDSRGRIIEAPPDGRAGRIAQESLRSPLAPASMSASAVAEQVELGFLAVFQDGSAPSRVYRLLAAPISNFGRQVGTLIVGQRVMAVEAEAPPGRTAGLRYTLWLDGRLAGGNIPAHARDPLTTLLERGAPAAGAEITASGTTYRLQRSLLNENSAYPPAYLVSIFSMEGFEEQQRSLLVRILAIGGVALLAAGLAALGLARQLARPIANLVDATREIRLGNFDQRLPPSSIREMTTLAESFNAMAADLALKERYHSVLQQVADPQVADELISGRVKLGGELRDVTVLFCDIRGYTAFTVGRPPETVIELLNHHMGAMTRVVQAHGGVINQFAGDAIMALFGAPKSYGDDTERAVRCARAMIHERERLNETAAIPMRVGIGIASGAMVAGCIGAENRSDYTVVGERVNLAARLCSSAAAGQVLIDDATWQRVAAIFDGEPLAPLSLKGFDQPVGAYRITQEREVTT